ncbi:hypothetical protein [Teredinibacter franksiae]|uniref:hypothetical protein n=1 Tax=Teredinibacter franksiae TaxID=2761453 RepID=UPI001623CCA8|nr:hypothetical protein [Teredinibacter franksiae]
MTSLFINSVQFCCSKLVLALCSLGICCPCLAEMYSDDGSFESSQSLFQNAQQATRLEFTPVSLMHDDALISSAEMRRDSSMNNNVRLLNSQWLLQNNYNTWSGGRAVGKVLKAGFKQFLATRYQTKSGLLERHGQADATTLWQNYSVSLSSNKILVGMQYRF